MKGSLQEQLLKSGLISEDQLKDAKKKPSKPAKKKNKPKKQQVKTNARPAPTPTPNPEQILKEKNLRTEVKKLLRSYKLNDKTGEVPYNYSVNNQVKRFYVTKQQQDQLIEGKLAIANWNDISYLIPFEAVAELTKLYPKIDISHVNNEELKTSDDDPYADYVVPDDIKW